jgi:nicotinate-nucleotide--dimethylbenzimidazole phosphoribosyltransferase
MKATLEEAIAKIEPADAGAMRRAQSRQRNLTKPPGSLGRLEDVSIQLAGIFKTERPSINGKAVIIAAGDHGVVAQGVTAYPQEVTAQMVLNFLSGGAAVSVMSKQLGVSQYIVDAGVASYIPAHSDLRVVKIGRGTDDITQGPAMTREQAEEAILAGVSLAVEAANSGADLIATGDMGIGNTTSSSAIAAAITGKSASEMTGKGTGRSPDELLLKAAVIQKSLEVNRPNAEDAFDVLAKVGGFEIGVLAGVALGAAGMRRAVVLDGFISGAAGLIAYGICPTVRDYMFASHRSAEKGHRAVLSYLKLRPLLDLGLRLGEGTGAVLAMTLVETAAACLSNMATFGEAGVSDRKDEQVLTSEASQ